MINPYSYYQEVWNRALELVRAGRPDEAVAFIESVMADIGAAAGIHGPIGGVWVADSLYGRILVAVGRHQEALRPLRAAIPRLGILGPDVRRELAAAQEALEEALRAIAGGLESLVVPIEPIFKGYGVTDERDLGEETDMRETAGGSVPADAVFQLRLEGEQVHAGQVVAGSGFDLVFDFALPAENLLAIAEGRLLEEARRDGQSFDVVVSPPAAFVFRDGVFARRAQLRDGGLQQALRFRLRAPPGEALPARERFWVSFTRRGRPFYQLPLDLLLVQELDLSRPFVPPHVDLDRLLAADLGDRRPRQAQLVLRRSGSSIRVACSLLAEDADSGEGNLLEVERFDALGLEQRIGVVKAEIEKGFRHLGWTEEGDLLSRNVVEEPGARENLERLATAGFQLYSFLCDDPAMKRILEAIELLPAGSRLDVQTDNVFLPWEILNRHKYNAGWHAGIKDTKGFQPQSFWGYRFRIEARPLAAIDDRGLPPSGGSGPTFVGINLNPSIDEEPVYQHLAPGASHLGLEKTLQGHAEVSLRREGAKIFEELSLATEPVTFIYLFCHGRRENPFQPGGSEQLELEKGTTVDPGALDNDVPFTHAPIVMLNSCSSGAVSPLQFDSFLSVFKKRGACGLVATTFPVPTVFAAAFGREVVESYARGDRSIGDVVLDLRRQLLENGNPLGLLYTLQCPLEARAPQRATVDTRNAA